MNMFCVLCLDGAQDGSNGDSKTRGNGKATPSGGMSHLCSKWRYGKQTRSRDVDRHQARAFKGLDTTMMVLGISEEAGALNADGSVAETDAATLHGSALIRGSGHMGSVSSLSSLTSTGSVTPRPSVSALGGSTAGVPPPGLLPGAALAQAQPLQRHGSQRLSYASRGGSRAATKVSRSTSDGLLGIASPPSPPAPPACSISAARQSSNSRTSTSGRARAPGSVVSSPSPAAAAWPLSVTGGHLHLSASLSALSLGAGDDTAVDQAARRANWVEAPARWAATEGVARHRLLSPPQDTSSCWPAEAHERLVADRLHFQATIHNVLDGELSHECLEDALKDAVTKADELQAQLIMLQTPPGESWSAVEDHLVLLEEHCLKRVADILNELNHHKLFIFSDTRLGLEYHAVVQRLVPDLCQLTLLCGSAVVDSFGRGLGDLAEPQVRAALKCAKRCFDAAVKVKDIVQLQVPSGVQQQQLCDELATCVASVASALVDATQQLVPELMVDTSLQPGTFAHSISSKVRLVRFCWRGCSDFIKHVTRGWLSVAAPSVALKLSGQLCYLYLTAADAAVAMMAVSPDDEEDEWELFMSCGSSGAWGSVSSVWGGAATRQQHQAAGLRAPVPDAPAAVNSAARVSAGNGEVQAQAWVPSLLIYLLRRAQSAHVQLREDLARAEEAEDDLAGLEDESVSRAAHDELYSLLDSLQAAFSQLALANTRRTATLCSSPEVLSCWALEICKDQAEQALRLVQQYDQGSLGMGDLINCPPEGMEPEEVATGLALFNALKTSTTAVVNALLRVKNLLKLRRSDEGLPDLPMRPAGHGHSHAVHHSAPVPPLAAGQRDVSRPGHPKAQTVPSAAWGNGAAAASAHASAVARPIPTSDAMRIPFGSSRGATSSSHRSQQRQRQPCSDSDVPASDASSAGSPPPVSWVSAANTRSPRTSHGGTPAIHAPPPNAPLTPRKAPGMPALARPSANTIAAPVASSAPAADVAAQAPAAAAPSFKAMLLTPHPVRPGDKAGDDGKAPYYHTGQPFRHHDGESRHPSQERGGRRGACRGGGHGGRSVALEGRVSRGRRGTYYQDGTRRTAGWERRHHQSSSPPGSSWERQQVQGLADMPVQQGFALPVLPLATTTSPVTIAIGSHSSSPIANGSSHGPRISDFSTGASAFVAASVAAAPSAVAAAPAVAVSNQCEVTFDVGGALELATPALSFCAEGVPPIAEPPISVASLSAQLGSMDLAQAACNGHTCSPTQAAADANGHSKGSSPASVRATICVVPADGDEDPHAAVALLAATVAPPLPPASDSGSLPSRPPSPMHQFSPFAMLPSAGDSAGLLAELLDAAPPQEWPQAAPRVPTCTDSAASMTRLTGQEVRPCAAAYPELAASLSAGARGDGLAPVRSLTSNGSTGKLVQPTARRVMPASPLPACHPNLSPFAAPTATLPLVSASSGGSSRGSGSPQWSKGNGAGGAQNGMAKQPAFQGFALSQQPGPYVIKDGDSSSSSSRSGLSERRDGVATALASQLPLSLSLAVRTAVAPSPKKWLLKWADLKGRLITSLGGGSFGEVFHGQYKHTDVAIKVLKIDNGSMDVTVQSFWREVSLQRHLNYHANIVRFIGACCEVPEGSGTTAPAGAGGGAAAGAPARPSGPAAAPMLAIVMEFCRLGNVFKMVGKARRVAQQLQEGKDVPQNCAEFKFYSSWLRRLEVAKGAAAGVEFMHDNGFVHRDLTSCNLLLDYGGPPTWVAKVCDFNLSHEVEGGGDLQKPLAPRSLNSPAWMAPEVLSGVTGGGTQADVFSFGTILYEILTLREPWTFDSGGKPMATDRIIAAVIRGQRPEIPELSPPLPEAATLLELVQACWAHAPEDRPSMQHVAATLADVLHHVSQRLRRPSVAA